MRNVSVTFAAVAFAAQSSPAVSAPITTSMPLPPNTRVELILDQAEMRPVSQVGSPVVDAMMMDSIVANNGGAGLVGGLIGGLIVGAAVNKAAKDSAEWGNKVAVGYDYRTPIETLIRTALNSPDISPSPDLQVVLERKKATSTCDTPVLRLSPLRWSAEEVSITSGINVSYYQCEPAKAELRETLQWSRSYEFAFVVDRTDPRKERKTLIENLGPQGVAHLLDLSAHQAVNMMLYDFSPTGQEEGKAPAGGLWSNFREIASGANWSWRRNGHPALATISGRYMLNSQSIGLLSNASFDETVGIASSKPTDEAASTKASPQSGTEL